MRIGYWKRTLVLKSRFTKYKSFLRLGTRATFSKARQRGRWKSPSFWTALWKHETEGSRERERERLQHTHNCPFASLGMVRDTSRDGTRNTSEEAVVPVSVSRPRPIFAQKAFLSRAADLTSPEGSPRKPQEGVLRRRRAVQLRFPISNPECHADPRFFLRKREREREREEERGKAYGFKLEATLLARFQSIL